MRLIKIAKKEKCCGCTACAAICPKNCIEMKEDREGFRYPCVDEDKCVECGACEKVCSILNEIKEEKKEQEGYIIQNKDQKVLKESTAGGAFTAIAQYVLKKNGVVFGVELSKDLQARHIYVENEQELYRFRNSKYMQSVMDKKGETQRRVKEFLNEDRYVCFSGTPCQIEGLKKYLKKDYPKLITVDVVCRAVPSPMIFRKYVEYQENKMKQKISLVRFRDKYYGYKYSTMNVVTDKNKGNYHKGVESDPWLRAFFSNICDRPSCHECHFRKQYRVSDFTIWDCFNVGRFSKELDNDRGATRMLVHSEKGKEIFKHICKQYNYVQVDPEKLIEGSKEVKESVVSNARRAEFFEDANKLNGVELYNKYFPETIKVKLERIVRLGCYKLGIYAIAKKVFVKITHKY